MRVSFIIELWTKCKSSLCFCNRAEIITMLTNTYFSVECIIIIIMIMSDNFMMPRGIKTWQCCCGPFERLKSSVGTQFAGNVIQDFFFIFQHHCNPLSLFVHLSEFWYCGQFVGGNILQQQYHPIYSTLRLFPQSSLRAVSEQIILSVACIF